MNGALVANSCTLKGTFITKLFKTGLNSLDTNSRNGSIFMLLPNLKNGLVKTTPSILMSGFASKYVLMTIQPILNPYKNVGTPSLN